MVFCEINGDTETRMQVAKVNKQWFVKYCLEIYIRVFIAMLFSENGRDCESRRRKISYEGSASQIYTLSYPE
jgi:hypothetical protein